MSAPAPSPNPERAPRLLLVDNYDSFSWNIVALFAGLGADVVFVRSDRIGPDDVTAAHPGYDGIVLGPGPGRPEQAGSSLELVRRFGGVMPLLGVCLGHQVIAQALGARIVRDDKPWHGKLASIHHQRRGLFAGLETPFSAVRYNSLLVEPSSVTKPLEVTAEDPEGRVMAIAAELGEAVCYGVQFHPESALSTNGARLASRFLEACVAWGASGFE